MFRSRRRFNATHAAGLLCVGLLWATAPASASDEHPWDDDDARCAAPATPVSPCAATLTLRLSDYARQGTEPPAVPRVYLGRAPATPTSAGDYEIPLRSAQGDWLVDTFDTRHLQNNGIPNGTYVVVRLGHGRVLQGFYGRFRRGSAYVKATTAIVNASVRSLHNFARAPFERQGDRVASPLKPGQDEYTRVGNTLVAQTSVSVGSDFFVAKLRCAQTTDRCAGVVCTASDQCHSPGICDPATGLCSNPPKADGSPCSDGSACTTSDTCQSGTCVAGAPVECKALDQCHSPGVCDPATGQCSNPPKPDGSACVDGDLCTQVDECHAGICVGTLPIACTALDQCHTGGTCDPLTGECSNPAKADGTSCDDSNECTNGDACQDGICVGGTPTVCDTDNPCQAGACDPTNGQCAYSAVSDGTGCEDGNACTAGDACQSGQCVGAPIVCGSSSPCYVGYCEPAIGQCALAPSAVGTVCGARSTCDGAGACICHRKSQSEACGAQNCDSADDGCGGQIDCGQCHANASCVDSGNTPRQCVCAAGYSGDGVACAPIDNCLTSYGGCSPFAGCTPTGPGTHVCQCTTGYTGTGFECAEIDNCQSDNGGCSPFAACTKTGPGSNTCQCRTGYEGDGFTCAEVDNCQSNNGGCHADATCTKTGPGTNTCACPDYLVGDGYACERPAVPARIELKQRSFLLGGAGETRELEAVAYDDAGQEIPPARMQLRWRTSDTDVVSVTADPADPRRATLRTEVPMGNAEIAVGIRGDTSVVSNRLGVLIAPLAPDVDPVTDAEVVFPTVNLPEGATPENFPLPDVTGPDVNGEQYIGPFAASELAALFETRPGTEDLPTLVRTAIVMRGAAPQPGRILIGTENAALLGRITQVIERGGMSLVQLENIAFLDAFTQLKFSLDEGHLTLRGLIATESRDKRRATRRKSTTNPDIKCEGQTQYPAIALKPTFSASFQNNSSLAFEKDDQGIKLVRVVVGFTTSIAAKSGIEFRLAIERKFKCTFPPKLEKSTPVPGPLAPVLSGYISAQPAGQFSVKFSGGPSGLINAQAGIRVPFALGGEWERSTGFRNLSGVDLQVAPDPTLEFTGALFDTATSPSGGFSVPFKAGAKLAGGITFNAGFKLLGTVGQVAEAITAWIPAIGAAVTRITSLLTFPIFDLFTAVEAELAYSSYAQTLQDQSNDGKVETRLLAQLGFLPKLQDMIKALGINVPFATQLQLVGQVPLKTTFQGLKKDKLEYTLNGGPRTTDKLLFVQPGDRVGVIVKLKENDNKPLKGDIWTKQNYLFGVNNFEQKATLDKFSDTELRGSWVIPEEVCGTEVDPGPGRTGAVTLYITGANSMFGLLETPSFLGKVDVTCAPLVARVNGNVVLPAGVRIGSANADCPISADVEIIAPGVVQSPEVFLSADIAGPIAARRFVIFDEDPTIQRSTSYMVGKHVITGMLEKVRADGQPARETLVRDIEVLCKVRPKAGAGTPVQRSPEPDPAPTQAGADCQYGCAYVRPNTGCRTSSCGPLGPVFPQGNPVPPPKKTGGGAQSFGDPHIATQDGLSWTSLDLGEFRYTHSNASGAIEVQARHERLPGFAGWASFLTAVAVRAGDVTLEVQLDKDLSRRNPPRVLLNGLLSPLPQGTYVLSDKLVVRVNAPDALEVWYNDPTVTPNPDDRDYAVTRVFIGTSTESGQQLRVGDADPNEPVTALAVSVRTHGPYAGILGTPDGDPANEFLDRVGTDLEGPSREFFDAWRIRERADSLFTYADGEGPDTFNIEQNEGLPSNAQLAGEGGGRNYIAELRAAMGERCGLTADELTQIDEVYLNALALELAAGRTMNNIFASGVCRDKRTTPNRPEPSVLRFELSGRVVLGALPDQGAAGARVFVLARETAQILCDATTQLDGSYSCGRTVLEETYSGAPTITLDYRVSGRGPTVRTSESVGRPAAGEVASVTRDFVVSPLRILRLTGVARNAAGAPLVGGTLFINGPANAVYRTEEEGRYTLWVPLPDGQTRGTFSYALVDNDTGDYGASTKTFSLVDTGVIELAHDVQTTAGEPIPPPPPPPAPGETPTFQQRILQLSGQVRNALVFDETGQTLPVGSVRVTVRGSGFKDGACTTTTASDGRFACALEVSATEAFTAEAQVEGLNQPTVSFEIADEDIPAPGGQSDKAIPAVGARLTTLRLRGTATSATGLVRGVTVNASAALVPSGGGHANTETGDQGVYDTFLTLSTSGAASGTLHYQFVYTPFAGASALFQTASTPFTAAANAITLVEQDVSFLGRVLAFTGQLQNVLASNRGVPGARVSISSPERGELCDVISDDNGLYRCVLELQTLDPLTVQYAVSGRGTATATTTFDELALAQIPQGGEFPVQRNFALSPTTLAVSGRVSDVVNRNVPNALVTAQTPGGVSGAERTNGAGQYTVYLMLEDGRTSGVVSYAASYDGPSGQLVATGSQAFSAAAGALTSLTANLAFDAELTQTGTQSRVAFEGQARNANGEGAPLSGARVEIFGAGAASALGRICDLTTANDGAYRCDVIVDVPSPLQVRYVVSFGAESVVEPFERSFPITPGVGSALQLIQDVVTTPTTAALAGRVTDGDGQPLSGLQVRVAGAASGSAFTDLQGEYAFNLPLGSAPATATFVITAQHHNGISASQTYTTPDGAITARGRALFTVPDLPIAARTLFLRGQVVSTLTDPARPLGGVAVTLKHAGQVFCDAFSTDYDAGNFYCNELVLGGPGAVELEYTLSGVYGQKSGTLTVPADVIPETGQYGYHAITLTLDATTARVSGSVRDAAGQPLANTQVRIQRAAAGTTTVATNDEGAYLADFVVEEGVTSESFAISASDGLNGGRVAVTAALTPRVLNAVAAPDLVIGGGGVGQARFARAAEDAVSAGLLMPAIVGDVAVWATGYQVYGIALSDGAVRWRATLPSNFGTPRFATSSPVVDATRGLVYVGASQGTLLGIAIPESGAVAQVVSQRRPCPSQSEQNVVALALGADGTVYAAEGNGFGQARMVCAVTATEGGSPGTVLWETALTGGRVKALALGGDGSIYVSGGGPLVALAPNGKVRWTADGFDSSPVALGADGTIHYVSDRLYALRPNGEVAYSVDLGPVNPTAPVLGPLGVYVSAGSRLVVANEAGIVRETEIPSLSFDGLSTLDLEPPTIADDGTALVSTGRSFAFEPTGASLYAVRPDGTLGFGYPSNAAGLGAPALTSDGTALVPSHELSSAAPKLYAIRTDIAGTSAGAWPKLMRDAHNRAAADETIPPNTRRVVEWSGVVSHAQFAGMRLAGFGVQVKDALNQLLCSATTDGFGYWACATPATTLGAFVPTVTASGRGFSKTVTAPEVPAGAAGSTHAAVVDVAVPMKALRVRGTITDAITNGPVANAVIQVNAPEALEFTDALGNPSYGFYSDETGSYEVVIHYAAQSESVAPDVRVDEYLTGNGVGEVSPAATLDAELAAVATVNVALRSAWLRIAGVVCAEAGAAGECAGAAEGAVVNTTLSAYGSIVQSDATGARGESVYTSVALPAAAGTGAYEGYFRIIGYGGDVGEVTISLNASDTLNAQSRAVTVTPVALPTLVRQDFTLSRTAPGRAVYAVPNPLPGSEVSAPVAGAADGAGRVYVALNRSSRFGDGAHLVIALDTSAQSTESRAFAARVSQPSVAADGRVYAATNEVTALTHELQFVSVTTSASPLPLRRPVATPDGSVYAGSDRPEDAEDYSNARLYAFDFSGAAPTERWSVLFEQDGEVDVTARGDTGPGNNASSAVYARLRQSVYAFTRDAPEAGQVKAPAWTYGESVGAHAFLASVGAGGSLVVLDNARLAALDVTGAAPVLRGATPESLQIYGDARPVADATGALYAVVNDALTRFVVTSPEDPSYRVDWSLATAGQVSGEAAVDENGRVYVVGDGRIYAVRATENGAVVDWTYEAPTPAGSSYPLYLRAPVAVGPQHVFVTGGEGQIIAIRR